MYQRGGPESKKLDFEIQEGPQERATSQNIIFAQFQSKNTVQTDSDVLNKCTLLLTEHQEPVVRDGMVSKDSSLISEDCSSSSAS